MNNDKVFLFLNFCIIRSDIAAEKGAVLIKKKMFD